MPITIHDLTDPKRTSPRFDEDGRTICWYVGDTFELNYTITLQDEAGTLITNLDFTKTTGNADMVFDFYNKRKNKVLSLVYGKNGVYSGTHALGTAIYEFNLNFDKTKSNAFEVGDYTYCITYKKDNAVDTVFGRGTIKVEGCH